WATASCSAVRCSDGSATLAAAYVRPSPSRTAAPSTAPIRARAARANVTSLVSSLSSSTPLPTPAAPSRLRAAGSRIRCLPLLSPCRLRLILHWAYQHRIDPVPTPGGALGYQP